MSVKKIKKGLSLPIAGRPDQSQIERKTVTRVALLGDDYVGMKPALAVAIGDDVLLGQTLFTDRRNSSIRFTSPGSGRVAEINRGARRSFESIVIDLDDKEDEITFESFPESCLSGINRESVIKLLTESGLWTSLRARPYGKIADPDTEPHSIFVNAMDTNPLAPSFEKTLEGREEEFKHGLSVISRLTRGKLYLCKEKGARIPSTRMVHLTVEEFSGPHPAGNVGTHIHFLDPVDKHKTVWHISADDLIAVGILFATGRLSTERVLSLAGPSVSNPRLIRTRLGASIEDIIFDEYDFGGRKELETRVISGSVFSGHTATGTKNYLGRYHRQITALPEGRQKIMLAWARPGLEMFSVKNIVLSKLFSGKRFNFDTAIKGCVRAIIPNGSYEKVMPLDILPTQLLRALHINDFEEAEKLGCLELIEEDLALCTFVCPSKLDYGPILRTSLSRIEKEG